MNVLTMPVSDWGKTNFKAVFKLNFSSKCSIELVFAATPDLNFSQGFIF